MRTWRERVCDDCGILRSLHFNQFGVIDCSITREQAQEAAALITGFVFFLSLCEVERRGLPLHPNTPMRQLVRVGQATI